MKLKEGFLSCIPIPLFCFNIQHLLQIFLVFTGVGRMQVSRELFFLLLRLF